MTKSYKYILIYHLNMSCWQKLSTLNNRIIGIKNRKLSIAAVKYKCNSNNNNLTSRNEPSKALSRYSDMSSSNYDGYKPEHFKWLTTLVE